MGFVGSWDWNHYRSIMFLYSTGQILTDPFQAPAQHDQIGPVLAVNWYWTKACKLTHRHVSSYFLRPNDAELIASLAHRHVTRPVLAFLVINYCRNSTISAPIRQQRWSIVWTW
jgi:hypothetical protein